MLGLGSNITSISKTGKTIVKDGLVLRHEYKDGPVQPLSDGAAHLLLSNTDFIDLGDVAAFDFAGDFTLSVWIRAEGSSGYNAIMSNYETNKGWSWILNNGKLRMRVDGSSVIDTGADVGVDLRDGKWHHVATTCTTSNVIIYVDGVLIENESGTWTPNQTASASTMIGKRTGVDNFDGYMCNAGIWSGVLSQAQIKSIMNKNYAGLSDSEKTSLVSWWNLDSVIPDTTTLVYDNHHGGGEVLGIDLVDDGNFDTDLSSWDITGNDATHTVTWTATGARYQSDTTSPVLGFAQVLLEVGKTYEVTCNIAYAVGSGALRCSIGGVNQTAFTEGFNTRTSVATSFTNLSFLRDAANVDAIISNVSVKLINGNTGTLS